MITTVTLIANGIVLIANAFAFWFLVRGGRRIAQAILLAKQALEATEHAQQHAIRAQMHALTAQDMVRGALARDPPLLDENVASTPASDKPH